MHHQLCKAGGLPVDSLTAMSDVDCQWRSQHRLLLMQFNSRIGEGLTHHWVSANHSESPWEAQVQAKHPHQGEREETQAEEC